MAALPSCGAVSGANAPWKPPMAVRAVPTMTIASSAADAMAGPPPVVFWSDGARRRAHGQQPRRTSSRAAVSIGGAAGLWLDAGLMDTPANKLLDDCFAHDKKRLRHARSAGDPARAGAAGGRRGTRRPGRVGRAHPGGGGGGTAAGTGAYQRRRGRLLLCGERLRRRGRRASWSSKAGLRPGIPWRAGPSRARRRASLPAPWFRRGTTPSSCRRMCGPA